MNLIKNMAQEDFDSIGFKNMRRNLRQLPQVKVKGVNKSVDASRHALLPGKRISKNGKIYWESRSDRTDNKNSNL